MNIMLSCIFLIFIILALISINLKADKLKSNHLFVVFAAIMTIGVIFRIVAVMKVPCEPISDYRTMFEAAKIFSAGGRPFTYGSYFQRFPHMTVYPVLCGFLMKLFGESVLVIKIFNIIFKTAAIFVAGLIGNELLNKKGMLSVALLYAIFPPDIFYTPVAATENFALTFLLLSLLFFLKAYKNADNKSIIKHSLFCGIFLAVGCLLRGVAPFYFAAYFAGILFTFKGVKKKFYSLISILLTYMICFQTVSFMLCYSGVTEYKITDKGEPYVVYMLVGSNFETNGMYSAEDHGVYFEAKEDPEVASKIAIERLINRLSENKEKIIPLWLKKTDIIWSDPSFNGIYWSMYENGVETEHSLTNISKDVSKVLYRFLLLMTFLAIVFHKDKKTMLMLALLPLAFEGGLMLIEIQPRYTFSVAYIFVIFASIGFSVIFNFVSNHLSKR